jgi:hypothetical protein
MSTRSNITISLIAAAVLSVVATTGHAAEIKENPQKFITAAGSTKTSADSEKAERGQGRMRDTISQTLQIIHPMESKL